MTTAPHHDTPEWHELRRSGLGGSDLPALLGVSRYQTPLALWQLKRGLILPSPGSDAALRGQELEDTALDMICARAGVERGPALPFVHHPRWDSGVHLLANLDGTTEAPTPGGILEAKTTNAQGVSWTYRQGRPPLSHLLQLHHYAACTGRRWAMIGCLIGSGEPKACELVVVGVEMHPVLIGLLEEVAADWWRRYVWAGEPPPAGHHRLATEISSVAGEVRCVVIGGGAR